MDVLAALLGIITGVLAVIAAALLIIAYREERRKREGEP